MTDDRHDLFDSLPDPVVVLGAGGDVLRSNPAFQALAEASGARTPHDLFGPAFAELLGGGADGAQEGRLPLLGRNGPARSFRVAVTKLTAGTLVRLVDTTSENAWRDESAARAHELAALHEIGAALSSTLELDVLAERIYEQTSRLLRIQTFHIALHHSDTGMITFPIHVEESVAAVQPPHAYGDGLVEHVLRTRAPLSLRGDVAAEAGGLGATWTGRAAQAWLGVPMVSDAEAIGVIVVQDYEVATRFTDHDVAVLGIIAAQAAASIRNAQLLAASRRAYEEVSATQAKLLESERLRTMTETVGALNHEVNNPLATISGNAQLLLRQRHLLDKGALDKIQRILEAANRIQSVTNKMANLIQASTMAYPGHDAIIDVNRSLARDEEALGEEPPRVI